MHIKFMQLKPLVFALLGAAALAARFQDPQAQTYTITADVHDTVADDDHVVQLVTAHATRHDGATLDYRTAEIFHVKDGKIILNV